MISKILIAVSFALFLGTAAYAGQVYKWSDEGRIIYSQTPPAPGVEFEVVFQDETGANTSVAKVDGAASNSGDSFEKRREERLQKKTDKQVQEESNKIKAENCAIATQNMQSLTSRGQVTVKDGDIYRKLSEEERQAKIQETQEQVSEYCDS
ncbi:MAG: DUF4124 domain-containing protein [Gammaproteobacteria bacterium]|nr:DUF4124 domain-containing protein [Gammaproteobacteria bacterium]